MPAYRERRMQSRQGLPIHARGHRCCCVGHRGRLVASKVRPRALASSAGRSVGWPGGPAVGGASLQLQYARGWSMRAPEPSSRTSANFARVPTKSANTGPKSPKFSAALADIDPKLSDFGQFWPRIDQHKAPNQPGAGKVGPESTEMCPNIRQHLAQFRPSRHFRPNLTRRT